MSRYTPPTRTVFDVDLDDPREAEHLRRILYSRTGDSEFRTFTAEQLREWQREHFHMGAWHSVLVPDRERTYDIGPMSLEVASSMPVPRKINDATFRKYERSLEALKPKIKSRFERILEALTRRNNAKYRVPVSRAKSGCPHRGARKDRASGHPPTIRPHTHDGAPHVSPQLLDPYARSLHGGGTTNCLRGGNALIARARVRV